MPMVMPSRSSPTISSMVVRLSGTRVAALPLLGPLDKRVPGPVRGSREVELEREPLLEPVGAADVDRIDAVERLLGGADDDRVHLGDLTRHRPRGLPQLV